MKLAKKFGEMKKMNMDWEIHKLNYFYQTFRRKRESTAWDQREEK